MHSSLASGKSATPPVRCIHHPLRDTSSAEYRLLVSLASVGASRELSSRRSPALAPYTCAVSPTFRNGAFLFVASALAAVPPARLTEYGNNTQQIRRDDNDSQPGSSQRFSGAIPSCIPLLSLLDPNLSFSLASRAWSLFGSYTSTIAVRTLAYHVP